MIVRFWKTMFSLYFTTLIISGLSIIGLRLEHLVFIRPTNAFQLLTLPSSFPSVWNIVEPVHLTNWFFPVLLLVLQAFLSGGFFGSLLRINTLQDVSVASFFADSMRSFLRLLLWSVLWDSIALAIAGMTHALPMLGVTAALVFLAVHYVFFFAPIGLVAEQSSSIKDSLKTAVQALLDGFLPMLPYAGLMVLLGAAALALSSTISWGWFLVLAIVYLALMTWLWHMVIARYLVFSKWVVPTTVPSTSQEK